MCLLDFRIGYCLIANLQKLSLYFRKVHKWFLRFKKLQKWFICITTLQRNRDAQLVPNSNPVLVPYRNHYLIQTYGTILNALAIGSMLVLKIGIGIGNVSSICVRYCSFHPLWYSRFLVWYRFRLMLITIEKQSLPAQGNNQNGPIKVQNRSLSISKFTNIVHVFQSKLSKWTQRKKSLQKIMYKIYDQLIASHPINYNSVNYTNRPSCRIQKAC